LGATGFVSPVPCPPEPGGLSAGSGPIGFGIGGAMAMICSNRPMRFPSLAMPKTIGFYRRDDILGASHPDSDCTLVPAAARRPYFGGRQRARLRAFSVRNRRRPLDELRRQLR
jgi:hypothetical protein